MATYIFRGARWRRIVAAAPRTSYSVTETARVLGVSRTHLYRLWKKKLGPPRVRLGARIVVPKAGLLRWLTERSDD